MEHPPHWRRRHIPGGAPYVTAIVQGTRRDAGHLIKNCANVYLAAAVGRHQFSIDLCTLARVIKAAGKGSLCKSANIDESSNSSVTL
jgi:hypothetical protein